MKKEVLLSLLMTTPVAFPALAQNSPEQTGNDWFSVNTEDKLELGEGWKSTLMPNVASSPIVKDNKTGVKAYYGVAKIERTMTLPKGQYKIDFGTRTKCTVKVAVGDGAYSEDYKIRPGKDQVDGVEITGETGTLKILIEPTEEIKPNADLSKAESFGVSKFDLELYFNFTDAKAAIDLLLNGKDASAEAPKVDPVIPAIANIDGEEYDDKTGALLYDFSKDVSEKAKKLRADFTTLSNEKTAITTARAELDSKPFDAYKTYKLYNTPNDIVSKINTLATKVTTHNTGVDNEKKTFRLITDNKAKRDALLVGQVALVGNVEELIVNINKKIQEESGKTSPNQSLLTQYNTYLTQANELLTNAKALESEIRTAYADDKLDTVINSDVETSYNGYCTKVEELNSNIGNASDDFNAYKAFTSDANLQKYNALLTAYDNARTTLSGLKGNTGYETIFASYLASQREALIDAFEEVDKLVEIKDGKIYLKSPIGASGVDGTAAKALKEIDVATNTVNNIAGESKTFVDYQNGLKTKADVVLTTVQNTFKASKCYAGTEVDIVVPSNFETEFNDEKAKVSNAIANLKSAIEKSYGNQANPLSETSYATEKNAVDGKQSDFNTWKTTSGKGKEIIEMQKAYNDLMAKFNNAASDNFIAEEIFNVEIAAIDAEIAKLTVDNRATSAPAIKTTIENLDTSSSAFVTAYEKVNCKGRLTAFKNGVKEKKILAGAVKSDNETAFSAKDYTDLLAKANDNIGNKKIDELVTTIDDKLGEIIDAHKATPGILNRTIAAINDLYDTSDNYVAALNTEIENLHKKFITEATEANFRAAANALEQYNEDVKDINDHKLPLFGKTSASSAEAAKKIGDEGDLTKAKNTAIGEVDLKVRITKCAEVDTALEQFISETVGDLNNSITDAIANLRAYERLIKKYNDEAVAAIKAAKAKNNEINADASASAVKAEFEKAFTIANDGLDAQSTALKTKIDAAAGMNKADHKLSEAAVAKESDLNTEITALKGAADVVKDNIVNNHTQHREQINYSEGTRQYINKIIDKLNESNKVDGNVYNPWDEDYKKLIADLNKIDQDIKAKYDAGVSYNHTEAFKDRMDLLKGDVDKILENYSDKYNAFIKAENDKLLTKYGWTGTYTDEAGNETIGIFTQLTAAIKAAIDDSNEYLRFSNPGLVEALAPAEIASKLLKLTDIQGEKNKLEANVKAYNTTETSKGLLITEAGLNESITKATGYLNEITKNDTGIHPVMTKAVADAAKSYYDTKHRAATDAISANNAALSQAVYPTEDNVALFSVESDTRAAFAKALNDAETEWGKADASKNPALADGYNAEAKAYKNMDKICNELDKIQKYKDDKVQEISSDFFNAYFKYLNDQVTAWDAKIVTYVKANLEDELNDDGIVKVKGFKTIFAEGKKELSDAKAKYATMTSGLSLKLTDAIAEMKGENSDPTKVTAYTKAKNAHDDAEEAHKANVTADQDKAAFEALYEGLEGKYNDLVDFSFSLAASNLLVTAETANVVKDLKAIKGDIDTFYARGYSSTEKTSLNNRIEAYPKTLPAAYEKVANAEYAELIGQWSNVYSLLNNALDKEGIDQATFDQYVVNLDALKTEIVGLTNQIKAAFDNVADDDVIAAIVALQKPMRDYEQTLSKYENDLNKTWMEEPLQTLLGDLNALYNKYETELNEAKAYLETCAPEVKAAYPAAFDKLTTDLAAVKTIWQADNERAIMQQNNYKETMAKISSDVNSKLNEITAMQEPYSIDAAKYDELLEIYNTLKTSADNLKETLDNSEFYKYTGTYDIVNESWDRIVYYNALFNGTKDAPGVYDMLADSKKEFTDKHNDSDVTKKLKATDVFKDENAIKSKLSSDIELNLAKDNFAGSAVAFNIEHENVKKALDNPNLRLEKKAELTALLAQYSEARAEIDLTEVPAVEGEETQAAAYNRVTAQMAEIISNMKNIVVEAGKYTFLSGDFNQDGETDIYDVLEFRAVLLDGITYDEVAAENPEKALAGDVKRDGKFSIGDLTAMINEAVGEPLTAQAAYAQARMRVARATAAPVEGANIVSTELIGVEGGVSRYAVNIQNSAAFVAGQLDFVLGEGMTIVDVQLAERSQGQTLATSSDNKRVILSNMTNAAIAGDNGAVIYVEVFGDGKLDVDNVVFADKNSVEYRLAKPEGTSGIEDTVIDNNGSLKQRVYNAAGQMLRGLQRGVNIIRNADGSVSKEYHK